MRIFLEGALNLQQLTSLVTVFVIISIFSAGVLVEAGSGGTWPALGLLFGWAFAFFFVFHTLLYLLLRLVRSGGIMSSYTTTKANCFSALVTILTTVALV